MRQHAVRVTYLAGLLFLLASASAFASIDPQDDETDPTSSHILQNFLKAEQAHEDSLRGASMQVDIDAAVPGLKEHGRLHALRNISKVGSVTYHVLSFQGDSSVKKDVIARYLQAEQQGQGDHSLAISPANYKFKYRGEKSTENGNRVYAFQLTPRNKKVGLFKGVLWVDTKTYLPVLEKGRLVKNPSIFFKKVEFERDFAVRDGLNIPTRMSSTIDVRLIGKVELSINYSNFEPNANDADETPQAALAGQSSQ